MKNKKSSKADAFWRMFLQESTGKPAKNDAVPQVLFGTVTQFNPERNFGIAVVDYSKQGGIKRSFSLSTKNGLFLIGIKKDSSFPEFVRLSDAYPPKGAEVVLEVSGLNGAMRVVRWGCAKSYQKAKQTIASRPTFRLMYWKDGSDEELARDSALGINAKFSRGNKDPLAKYASKGESDGYLYWLRQEPESFKVGSGGLVFSDETVWVETGDPRPMPAVTNEIHKLSAKKQIATAPEAMPKKPASERKFSREFKGFDQLVLA